MRPLRIELYGFTAFRDPAEVDLADLDLFVITGPTGAGKTSLLDAMIFALYGKVPRAGSHGMRELVSQGMAEARVMLEFSLDGERHRIARRLPRVGAQSATLEKWNGDGWESELDSGGVTALNRRVVELLKLPYEAFTKAVVLPQGQFQEFLKGDRAERRTILTDLLGLKHYLGMGERARARGKALKTGIAATQEVLDQQYADVGEDALTKRKDAATSSEVKVNELAANFAAATELDEKRKELARAVSAPGKALQSLRDLRSELSETQARAKTSEAVEAESSRQLRSAQSSLQKRQEVANKAGTQLRRLVDEHGDLERLGRVEGALEDLEECQREQGEQEGLLATATAEADGLDASLAKARVRLAKVGKKAEESRKGSEQAATTKAEAEREAEQLDQLLSRVDEAVEENVEIQAKIEPATQRLAAAHGAMEPAEAALAEAAEAHEALRDDHSAAALVAGLEAGDPCPICRRPLKEHPHFQIGDDEIEAAGLKLQAAREAQGKATAELKVAEEAMKEAEARLTQSQRKVEHLLGKGGTRDRLVKSVVEAKSKRDKAREVAIKVARDAQDGVQKELAGRTEVTSLEGELKSCHRQSELITKSIKGIVARNNKAEKLLIEYFGSDAPGDAADQLAARRRAVTDAQSAAAERAAELEQARTELAALQEEAQTSARELADVDVALAALRARAEQDREDVLEALEQIAGVGRAPALPRTLKDREKSAATLVGWCESTADIVKQAKAEGERAVVGAERSLLDLAKEAGLEAEQADAVCPLFKKAEGDLRTEHGLHVAAVKEMQSRINERDQLTAKIATQSGEATLLNDLAAELRGDRFIAFIQQETLDLLAARASEELQRISGRRYSLISDDGDFSVIDHINADEQRSVDTLSGGETFLASLSLALALSQHVGDLATENMGAKLEAVFIDEGFGALDDETLDEVIDALERLREGDLMVGVITHVPALAQRIKEGLRVETAAGKSIVHAAEAA